MEAWCVRRAKNFQGSRGAWWEVAGFPFCSEYMASSRICFPTKTKSRNSSRNVFEYCSITCEVVVCLFLLA